MSNSMRVKPDLLLIIDDLISVLIVDRGSMSNMLPQKNKD